MSSFRQSLLAGVGIAVLCLSPVAALADRTVQSQAGALQVETIAGGLEHPWGLAFLPDGRFLVTERDEGRLRIGTRDGKLSEPVAGVPEIFRFKGPTDRSQGGLFHVALDPDFAGNALVYLSFSQPSEEGAGTAVARGRLVEKDGTARLDDVEVVYTMNKHDSGGLHFGGRFVLHPQDDALYVSVGDRRNMSRALDKDDHAGSVIRVTRDGAVPQDNPFIADETDDKIFSYGHRNIQGMAIHPETGELWVNDHGPQGGDEIKRVGAGMNFGWPMRTGGLDYSDAPIGKGAEVEGYESPVHIFEKTVGPSGLAIYGGKLFVQWQGHFLHGSLAGEALVRTKIEDGKVTEEEVIDIGRRIRDVQVADDGALWLITEHSDGEVLRITPAEDTATGSGGERR